MSLIDFVKRYEKSISLQEFKILNRYLKQISSVWQICNSKFYCPRFFGIIDLVCCHFVFLSLLCMLAMSTRVVDLLEHRDISENVRNAARVVDSKICSVKQRFMRDTALKGQVLNTFSHGRGKKN